MNQLSLLLMFVLLIGMWFFMSRTQKKQQQERQSLLDSMKTGDRVVTIGGLHGVLSEINEDKRTVMIDCEGIFLEFDRAAIKTVKPGAPAVEATEDEVTVTETVVEEETIKESKED